jgi:putative transposase
MPRAARRRLWTEAACYHVLNRGHARETVFHDDPDRLRFLELLDRYRRRFGLRLYHYCLMDNHFHLLLQLPQPAVLSRLVAGLLVAYWHHYRRRHGLVGHLFQGRFKSPAVEADAYLLSCGRYIERNPVEAGLVEQPWQYRWSSARAYGCGEQDPLLAANPWYEALAAEPGRRQALWREFLLGEDPKEAAVRRQDWVVGGAAFRTRMQQCAGRPAPRRRGRPRKLDAVPTPHAGPFSTESPSRQVVE